MSKDQLDVRHQPLRTPCLQCLPVLALVVAVGVSACERVHPTAPDPDVLRAVSPEEGLEPLIITFDALIAGSVPVLPYAQWSRQGVTLAGSYALELYPTGSGVGAWYPAYVPGTAEYRQVVYFSPDLGDRTVHVTASVGYARPWSGGSLNLTCYDSSGGEIGTASLHSSTDLYDLRQTVPLNVSGSSFAHCELYTRGETPGYGGGYFWTRSVTILSRPRITAGLKLECGGVVAPAPLRVTRGTHVRCGISAEPAGGPAPADAAWTFTSGAVTVTPDAGENVGMGWGGPIVVAGTISVTAKVAGTTFQKAIDVSVEGRRWPRLRLASPAHDSTAGHLPPAPAPDTSWFGVKTEELADSHLQHDAANMPYTGRDSLIGSGPNRGYSFVSAPLRDPYFLVHVSNAWKPGNPWYQKQNGPSPYCWKPDIRLLERRARHHEGIGGAVAGDIYQPSDTHFTAARRFFANEKDVNAIYERLMQHESEAAATGRTFGLYLQDVWADSVQAPHDAYNNGLVHTPGNLVPVHCKVRP
jgi:hypothetical protein